MYSQYTLDHTVPRGSEVTRNQASHIDCELWHVRVRSQAFRLVNILFTIRQINRHKNSLVSCGGVKVCSGERRLCPSRYWWCMLRSFIEFWAQTLTDPLYACHSNKYFTIFLPKISKSTPSNDNESGTNFSPSCRGSLLECSSDSSYLFYARLASAARKQWWHVNFTLDNWSGCFRKL